MSTEPNLVMVEAPDGSVHARPGLGETLKRIETEFFVFVGDDPDNAKVGVNADGIDDAAGILAAMPGASIAIRELYAGAWAVHRPKPVAEPDLCARCDEWKFEAERMRLQFAVETKRVGILADCLKAGGYHSPDGFHAQPGHGKSCRECNALREALGPLSAEAQT